MFLPRNCYVGWLRQSFGLEFPPCKQCPHLGLSRSHHHVCFGGWQNIVNLLLEVKSFILGLILHPKVKLCEISFLDKFRSIHCISNDFLNRFFHVINHFIFWIIPDKFMFDAVHIITHILVYDGVVDFFLFNSASKNFTFGFPHWVNDPKASELPSCLHKWA